MCAPWSAMKLPNMGHSFVGEDGKTVGFADAHLSFAKMGHPAGEKTPVERAIMIRVEAFDWNCPQHIVPRYSEGELAEALQPMRARMAELEAAVAGSFPSMYEIDNNK